MAGPELAALLRRVIRDGHRYRWTKCGIVVYGPDGMTAGTHFTGSDRRGIDNFRANLRRMGINTD